MKTLFYLTLISLCLMACQSLPTVRYSPPLSGDKPKLPTKDSVESVFAGMPLEPTKINWYMVIFYVSLVLVAIWFYFKNENGSGEIKPDVQPESDPVSKTKKITKKTTKKN